MLPTVKELARGRIGDELAGLDAPRSASRRKKAACCGLVGCAGREGMCSVVVVDIGGVVWLEFVQVVRGELGPDFGLAADRRPAHVLSRSNFLRP